MTDPFDEPQPQSPEPPGDTGTAPGRPPRRRRRTRTLLAVLVTTTVITGAVVALRAWPSSTGSGSKDGDGSERHSTTAVERTSLASGLELDGELGHGPAADVIAQGRGTFTKLPRSGERVDAGEVLYELDAQPVVLFTGDRPFWRELAAGMSDGPDVQQLERNLTDLGFADASNLTVDEEFTEGTADAVERWQKSLGLPRTGKVELGRVSVLPHDSVRIDQVDAELGGTSVPGAGTRALTVTAPDVHASVELKEDQIALLTPGSTVTVELASGGRTQGKVRNITPAAGADDGGGGGGDEGGGGQGGGEGGGKPTAGIALQDQKKAAKELSGGRSEITVTVPDRKVEDALVVPVTALLALADGGYGVQVVRAGKREPVLVPVEVGLIVNTRAQVTGSLREGEKVVVPA